MFCLLKLDILAIDDVSVSNARTDLQAAIDAALQPFALDSDNLYTYVIDPFNHSLILDKAWLIMFFAPKCHNCATFKPIFNEFHRLHKTELNVGAVNCEESK